MFLIDDILLAPLKGIAWLGEKFRDVADKELFDPDKIQEELMTNQANLDMGEISQEDYNAREKDILERLNKIQESKEGGK